MNDFSDFHIGFVEFCHVNFLTGHYTFKLIASSVRDGHSIFVNLLPTLGYKPSRCVTGHLGITAY